ncbi:hypothetical protein [Nocardia sp. CA-120079]|uniref:hypothetical protein n=1 Tax=Nocardia sp. CA-120079 TaxID=3239974 RepID=UPI003D958EE9
MLTAEQKARLSDVLRPAAPPQELTGVYTDDQRDRLLGVVRDHGPWKLIIAQHFASGEELIATMSGNMPDGVTPTLDMYLTPTFRGYLANYGTSLYPEINDCFYNDRFIDLAKQYWKAEYAKPEMMLFNINGPCGNMDPGHLDSPSFRGLRIGNTPTWLLSVMGKSGLFQDYLIKMAQVITWFCHDEASGFTYWPEGPLEQPQRLLPPTYNKGVLVQNEMMVHRGEANGPLAQRKPQGLGFDTVFAGDPDDRDHWVLKTGNEVIARHRTDDLRFLVHWSAEVFADYDELKKNMDGTADLTLDQVFDTFAKDLQAGGIALDIPSEPLHDGDFIRTLSNAYDLGMPAIYPDEAKPDWMLVA